MLSILGCFPESAANPSGGTCSHSWCEPNYVVDCQIWIVARLYNAAAEITVASLWRRGLRFRMECADDEGLERR